MNGPLINKILRFLRYLRLQQTQSGRNVPPIDRIWTDQATEEDIYYCFRLLLGRPPNRAEVKGHFGRMGEDLTGVVRSYIGSLEFAKRGLMSDSLGDDVELIPFKGFSIYASALDAAVGKHVKGGSYEPEVASVFRRFLKPGMTVLDVGANVGFFTMLAASLVGPTGCVVAVEPNAQNVRLLEASRRANGFEHVVVAYAAAGKEVGVLALNTSYSNGTTSPVDGGLDALMSAQLVPCFPLTNMAPATRRIDFIKIDVEGAEYVALHGARERIREDRPIIVSEFSPGMIPGISGVSGEEYLELIRSMGYRLAVIQKHGEPVSCDIDGVMAAYRAADADHVDILAVPLGPNQEASR